MYVCVCKSMVVKLQSWARILEKALLRWQLDTHSWGGLPFLAAPVFLALVFGAKMFFIGGGQICFCFPEDGGIGIIHIHCLWWSRQ